MNSRKRKIKIELEDEQGSKYNLSIEGNVSKEKILRVIELIDSVEPNAQILNNMTNNNAERNTDSMDSKIWYVVESFFSSIKFTSIDVARKYEMVHKESIKHSIISTYLSRYCSKGKLVRNKKNREFEYQICKLRNTIADNEISNYSYNNLGNYSKNQISDRKTIHDLMN